MNRKTIIVVGIIATTALLTVTGVTAFTQTYNTPLYTLRMEQASSNMHFLPTTVNEFTYNAEKEFTLNMSTQEYGGAQPLGPLTEQENCTSLGWYTCSTCETCETCETCKPCE